MAGCCAVTGNDCCTCECVANCQQTHHQKWTCAENWTKGCTYTFCSDTTSADNFLFTLGPGPPAKFGTTGNDDSYQSTSPERYEVWQIWGTGTAGNGDLRMGDNQALGVEARCDQGKTYAGTSNQICGGSTGTWGETNMEVWYPVV